ncbi:MAG: hypothetical protein XU15_C0011G0055 [candidate division NC10 bacterium CSP1-5]|nr:MAG: hypothetical protein XU15_C0011G0055 [candidate division NC10 bacterium CSP1-5]
MSSGYKFVNKASTRPSELRPGMAMAVKVVAVLHTDFPSWCAYQGPTDWSDQQVADQGDEILQEAAERLFPTMRNHAKEHALEYYNP